jgi:hypothetical protein
VEAGASLIGHFGKLGTVVSPMLKVSYLAAPYFAARAAISSAGIGWQVDGSAGSALVRQELGTVDAVFLLPQGSAVRALLSAGVGAYHLHVQGISSATARGLSGDSWSLALMPGLGVQADIGPRIALALEGQTLFAVPPPSVRIVTEELGPAGNPSVVVTAGILGTF